MYRLAESYLPPATCLKPILVALSDFKLKDIDPAFLSNVYSLPAGLLEMPSLQKFIATCKQKLLELFGDVPSIIKDPEQRQRFFGIPFAAVLAWLQSDEQGESAQPNLPALCAAGSQVVSGELLQQRVQTYASPAREFSPRWKVLHGLGWTSCLDRRQKERDSHAIGS